LTLALRRFLFLRLLLRRKHRDVRAIRDLEAPEYALLEEGLKGVEGASWGSYRLVAHARMSVPSDDIRSRLPADVVRSRHPEVLIEYDGRRTIEDPESRWLEFTGKGAGRVKQGSPQAAKKRCAYEERYELMKRDARALIERQRG